MLIARLLADPATLEASLDAATIALDREGLPLAHAQMNDYCGEVLELMLPGDDGETLRRVLDEHFRPSDLMVSDQPFRIPDVFVSDMDSTMIGQECIDELAAEAGVGELVSAITARAMNGELDFEGALIERVGLLAGLDMAVIERLLAERITPAPGGAALVRTMKANGAHTVLVSGGFTAFAERVAERLGFDESQSNVLEVAEGRLTGEVRRPILGRNAKAEMLARTARRLGVDAQEVIAAGDGANDLGMLSRAGMGVAVHAKPAVAAQCGLRVTHGDLTALLYLQGYAKADFNRATEEPLDFAV